MTKKSYPRIVFVGVHREAVAPLRLLTATHENVVGLATLTDEAAANISAAVDLTPFVKDAGIPVFRTQNVNDAACVEWIAGLDPDIVLVVGWTQLLKEPLLRTPRVAALGFHASLLPKYRGRAPVNWAIINGETETGNTMIVLAPGADEGDIVAQRRIPIGPQDTCGSIYKRVGETAAEMLREVLPLIRQGRMPRRPQDDDQSSVMPRRRPEDGGIDWAKSSRQLHDWVRALTHPYPGAFTLYRQGGDHRRLWVWRAASVERTGNYPVGTVTCDAGGWPVVATHDGGLRLLSVQIDGHREIYGNRSWTAGLRQGMRFLEKAQ
jgi:methionyl-tRNA formyltransferase